MEFGKWILTDKGIEWNGNGISRFTIPKDEINKTTTNNTGDIVFYDWILQATDQEWLSHDDLYDLNFAFVYAVAKYGVDFSYEILDDTLDAQYDLLEEEDDEDCL